MSPRAREAAAKAAAGELGALRWALLQKSDDAGANHTLIVMSRFADKSWECYLSIPRIAEEVGSNARTIRRKIKHLVQRGYLREVSVEYPDRRSKTYRLILHCE